MVPPEDSGGKLNNPFALTVPGPARSIITSNGRVGPVFLSNRKGAVMKVRVDEDLCIGSSACEQICPEVFQVVDGISKVQVDEVPPELEDDVRDAVDSCPMDAIFIEEE